MPADAFGRLYRHRRHVMLIDLTMTLREGMASHPSHGRTPLFLSGTLAHERLYPGLDRKNPYDGSPISFANANVHMCDHTGTHMDAPVHGDPNGMSVEQMPLDYGYGDAVWLDLSQHCDDEAQLEARDLEEAEHRGGEQVRPGDIVLVWTGWSEVLPDVGRYVDRHMGLTQDAAVWLRDRGILTLGIDTCTPETTAGVKTSPVHMNFLRPSSVGADQPVAIIENLVGIDRIPTKRFKFRGLPLPFAGLTGSPLRAVADVSDG
jgi:kynurenine formamidase